MSPSADALAEVRRVFTERHATGKAPSTVYGVLAGGALVDGDGFGDGATVDTAYRIASVTKSFTAAALLLQRDRGLLGLDDPVTSWVPELRLTGCCSSPPTLRMLLTMSGGLASDDPWADREEALTDDQFDAVIGAGVRCMWEPGTAFEYSNLGYALLGRVVGRAAGRPFLDVVRDELLRPLALDSTGWDAAVAAPEGVATGFERVDEEWRPLPFTAPGAFSPIGGLFSTVRDLCRWMHWFMDDTGPLTPATKREMCQGIRLRPDGGAYGFGLNEEHQGGHTVVQHSGGYPGFSAHIRWHPASGLGIAALENATYAGVAGPAAEAMGALLAGVDGGRTPWPETLAAQGAVMRLVRDGWDDALAGELFTPNVAADRSYARRQAELADALARTGALGEVVDELSETPANRAWTVRGEHADLRIDISLQPLDAPRVQWFDVEVR